MFGRILVAADTLGRTSRGLYVAERLAQRLGSRLYVVHVEPPSAAFDTSQEETDLRSIIEAIRDQNIEACLIVDYGPPDATIRSTAKRVRADLIVMAPHDRFALEALRHPSVTEQVLADAPAPVLAWPQHLDPHLDEKVLHMMGSVVLVPLDGSELAEEALPLAVEIAHQYGRGVLLLRVLSIGFQPAAGPQTYERRYEEVEDREHEARQYLTMVRARLLAQTGAEALPVEFMVKRGNAAEQIIRTAEVHPGSVVVMSTRGRSGLVRLLLGSVTTDVVRRAPVPVFIVPPGMKAATATTRTGEVAAKDLPPAALAGTASE